jgi:hypothetical protein
MRQLFHPAFNSIARITAVGAPALIVLLIWLSPRWERSVYVSQINVAIDQPVPFSHRHHVGGLGLDCRYCHWPVERSPVAGVPPTEVCMGCHEHLWTSARMLAPVRASWESGEPVSWVRVHDLPDFVYFDHIVHVAKGVACRTCHGPVNEMPLVWKTQTLYMEWCLDCHRDTLKSRGRVEDVFAFGVGPNTPAERGGAGRSASFVPDNLTDCSICHR